jgi:hypothetical protein
MGKLRPAVPGSVHYRAWRILVLPVRSARLALSPRVGSQNLIIHGLNGQHKAFILYTGHMKTEWPFKSCANESSTERVALWASQTKPNFLDAMDHESNWSPSQLRSRLLWNTHNPIDYDQLEKWEPSCFGLD